MGHNMLQMSQFARMDPSGCFKGNVTNVTQYVTDVPVCKDWPSGCFKGNVSQNVTDVLVYNSGSEKFFSKSLVILPPGKILWRCLFKIARKLCFLNNYLRFVFRNFFFLRFLFLLSLSNLYGFCAWNVILNFRWDARRVLLIYVTESSLPLQSNFNQDRWRESVLPFKISCSRWEKNCLPQPESTG